jgi:alanine racemase
MHRTTLAHIDLAALGHNFEQARLQAPDSRVMAVIKANAYGHGLLPVAEALATADGFAVACVDEAMALRRHGIEQPITVFQGFADDAELAACVDHRLWPVVHDATQLQQLEDYAGTRPPALWLKITTGMNRLGFPSERTAGLVSALYAMPGIETVRLMTHMACADEGVIGDAGRTDFTARQIARFAAHTAGLDCERSLANSAALTAWPEARADWVRPGIMLYGASPFLPGRRARALLDLKPVMSLTSRLIAINRVRRGDAIGYGGIWQCPEDMPVGVVSIGYGDGYPRHIDETARVAIRGQSAPVVGRVSMDLVTVDLRAIDAAVGDEVELWGRHVPVDDIAESADTIAYELLCGVYGRVRYEYG